MAVYYQYAPWISRDSHSVVRFDIDISSQRPASCPYIAPCPAGSLEEMPRGRCTRTPQAFLCKLPTSVRTALERIPLHSWPRSVPEIRIIAYHILEALDV